jgi:hypothetical protein
VVVKLSDLKDSNEILNLYLQETLILQNRPQEELIIINLEENINEQISNEIIADRIKPKIEEDGIIFEKDDFRNETLNANIQDNSTLLWKDRFATFPSVDLSNIEKPKIELFLCKPDKTIISKLIEAYEINLNIKALQINELNFKIPLKIDKHNELIDNPNISLVRYRYLIKVVLTNPGSNNNYIEFFRVKTPLNESTEDADFKHYNCLSLIDELSERFINSYNVVSFTLDEVFNGGFDVTKNRYIPGILTGLNWQIASPGGISNRFTFRRRSLDITGDNSILNFILTTLVETYNMLPIFNTNNRTIYIYSPEEIGKTIDQDILRVSYNKYLKSMGLTQEDSEFTTRLRVKGKDNLTINSITPTGQPYLENFDYFLNGYEYTVSETPTPIVMNYSPNLAISVGADPKVTYAHEQLNCDVLESAFVIKASSDYWSNELCQAQLVYQDKLQNMSDDFNNLLTEKTELEIEKANLDIDGFNALTELYFVQDIVDVLHGIENGIHRFEQSVTYYELDLNFCTEGSFRLGNINNSINDTIILPFDTNNITIQEALQDSYNNSDITVTEDNNKFIITFPRDDGEKRIFLFNKLTIKDITLDTAPILTPLDLQDNILIDYNLNPNWYYYFMIRSSSLDDLVIKINGVELQNQLTSDTWQHGLSLKYYGENSISIDLIGNTNKHINFDIVRITQDEYLFNGAKEVQIIFLGDTSAGTWKLGNNNNETWTNDMPYNVLESVVLAELQILYNNNDIIVKKGGSMSEGNVYFEISFPYSLGDSSNLVGDFDDLGENNIAFIVQKQKRITLLDKYNEHLKQENYNDKINLIVAKQSEIMNINNQINIIKQELSLENNFTTAEIEERNNFIIEKTYNNGNIITPSDLLEAASAYFEEVNKPALLLNIQLVNFMEIAESYYDFNKLFYAPLQSGLYDIIIINHELHNINVECMILEINYNFESSDITFNVSNVRELLDPESKFLKDLRTSTVAATTILNEKYKWDGANETATELDNILNETWSAAERAINSGVDNSITIDRRGIRITDPNNPLHVIAIVAGWLGISADGGNNYRTVLNADGIAAKYLIGQIVLAAQLHIINQGGNITIDDGGLKVYDDQEILRIHIGNLADPEDASQYGFYFRGKTDIETGQEHYLEWDGQKLNIGGDLDGVTGNFRNLIAGRKDISYMKLYEEALEPYIDFYANLIKRMTLDKESIKFYDENSRFTGYIQAWFNNDENRSVLDLGSNDISFLRSYITDGNNIIISRVVTEIYPQPYLTLQAYDNINNLINSYIQISDSIDIVNENGDIAIGSTGKIDIESLLDDINIIAYNGDIRIHSHKNTHIGSSIDFDNLYQAYDITIEEDQFNIGIGTTNGMIGIAASKPILLSAPIINLDGGEITLTGINGDFPSLRYKFVKNGTSGIGIINFICP